MADMKSEKFRSKLRLMMKRRNFTQDRLAEKLGTDQSRVGNWCSGKHMIGTEYLVPLARELGCSVDYLLDDAIERPSPADNAAEERLLSMIRVVGYVEAERRLMQVPSVVHGPTVPAPSAEEYGGKFGGQVDGTSKQRDTEPGRDVRKRRRS